MFLKKRQIGSLYIVVIFVLVVMGFLATTLSRIEWSNNDAHTKDVIGIQAHLLAHSAIEQVLVQIYPPRANITVPFDVASACTNLDGSTMNFATTITCADVQITCSSTGGPLVDNSQLYTVRAVAMCGTGVNVMQRSQDVWVKE
ncbi:MSHA biogenesis protein MshP [Vibrio sp. 10N.237.312.B06]|uniref:MSHA biogenesis protein MshP n=1 Tax=Vibrio sp. 10N.237.312.B06 TaxID=3229974 RepID=UPI0035518299